MPIPGKAWNQKPGQKPSFHLLDFQRSHHLRSPLSQEFYRFYLIWISLDLARSKNFASDESLFCNSLNSAGVTSKPGMSGVQSGDAVTAFDFEAADARVITHARSLSVGGRSPVTFPELSLFWLLWSPEIWDGSRLTWVDPWWSEISVSLDDIR